jgi:PAS domain-containing protein
MDERRVLFANKALIEMLGIDRDPNQPEDFDALHLGDLMDYIAPGSLAEAYHHVLDLVNLTRQVAHSSPAGLHRRADMEEITPFPLELIPADGSHVRVWGRGMTTRYGGRAIRVAILRDISRDKAFHLNCEDAIDWERAWAEMLEMGLVSAKDGEHQGVIIHDTARILYANNEAAAVLGVADPDELVGQAPLSFVSPQSPADVVLRMVGSNEGSEVIEIVTSHGGTATVGVRWQTVMYLGTAVRVSYITGVSTCTEVVEDDQCRK